MPKPSWIKPKPPKRWMWVKVYSCPDCWKRNPEPPRRKSDKVPYCMSCFVKKGEFVQMVEIRAREWKRPEVKRQSKK